jgi:broad specificity polyphosphatase/5'/3'-nucleotidase SurE
MGSWICAPEYEQSGASRSLTLAEPLRVRAARHAVQRGDGRRGRRDACGQALEAFAEVAALAR